MNNVMVDLETMGTAADSAIVAIGAVRFDSEKGVTDKFYATVNLQSSIDAGLRVDGDTMMWWLDQSEEARAALKQAPISLVQALSEFGIFLGRGAKLWGNGAGFDNPILATAYSRCKIVQPWKFWDNRCYRTVKNLVPHVKLDRVGTYHNAVHDADTQARHLLQLATTLKITL